MSSIIPIASHLHPAILTLVNQPDFELDGLLDLEAETGSIVFPNGCQTDAERIAHLEYRVRYLRELMDAAHDQQAVDVELRQSHQRAADALRNAKAAQQNRN